MEPCKMGQSDPNNLNEFTEEGQSPSSHYFEQRFRREESGDAHYHTPTLWSTSMLADVINLERRGNAVQINRGFRMAHSRNFHMVCKGDGQKGGLGHGSYTIKSADGFEEQGTANQFDDWYMKLNKDTMEPRPVWELQWYILTSRSVLVLSALDL